MKEQLSAWVARVEEVWADPLPPGPGKKNFVPKNGIQNLSCYRSDPGSEFWDKFPKNLHWGGEPFIKLDKLRTLAERTGYDGGARFALVCKDLSEGADIGCAGAGRSPSRSTNAPSALEYPEQVTDAVATWVIKGLVYGPVEEDKVPANAKVNGIMCKEKPNGSVRIILNMSAPHGNSVNDGVDLTLFPAVMSSTGKWLEVLDKAGRNCVIAKLDWSDAYKHIRVRNEDLNLQWFSWLGKYFAELCLIFGTSSSVGIYDRAAKVVLDLVLKVCGFPRELVCQHLDDVCAAGPAGSQCLAEFVSTYRKVAEEIGVRLAPTDDPDKAFNPCQQGTVLGVTYDTKGWTWAIPEEKESRILHALKEAITADHMRQGDIWSLVGRILHYCPLIPTGRFNIDHLIAANSVSDDRRYPVEITKQLRRQLWFWLTMIRATSGHTMIPDPADRFPAWTRECYTDSAGGSLTGVGRGAGAVSQEWWVQVPWPRKINCGVKAADGKKLSRKLSALELVGPLICIAAGAEWCRSRPVRVWVDNIGSVRIWKKGYSTRCALCTTLVKAIATVAAGLGCRFTIEKITRCSGPGAKMADSLSKGNFNEFRRTALASGWALAVAPACVPGQILAWLQNPRDDEDLGQRILQELSTSTEVLGVRLQ